MYLGRERHDRTVALVLAAALVAVAVLGLLVTLASAGAGATGAARDGPASTTATTASPAPVAPQLHEHGDQPPVDPGDGGVGHPWRLVGTLVGVVLLFGCGVLVTHEVRRRADDAGSSGGPGEWIS